MHKSNLCPPLYLPGHIMPGLTPADVLQSWQAEGWSVLGHLKGQLFWAESSI